MQQEQRWRAPDPSPPRRIARLVPRALFLRVVDAVSPQWMAESGAKLHQKLGSPGTDHAVSIEGTR